MTNDPRPRVEPTRPPAPAPAPPAPRVVPPVPEPTCPPSPPTPPPGVFCTMPAVYTQRCLRSSLGTQDVRVGDVQVIARDGDVQIVLQREIDGVIQRQIEFALVHELINARGIRKVWGRQVPRSVRPNRVGKMRHRLGVVQDGQRPGAAGSGAEDRVLGEASHGQRGRSWRHRRAG